MEFVDDACLEIIIKHPLIPRKHGDHMIDWKLFIVIFCCMRKPSLTCEKYILTFIEDFSIFTWVYFLKIKSHVFERFKKFKALSEKQCGLPIKCLISKNGGEYVSHKFE